jgi:hypothetical protein
MRGVLLMLLGAFAGGCIDTAPPPEPTEKVGAAVSDWLFWPPTPSGCVEPDDGATVATEAHQQHEVKR